MFFPNKHDPRDITGRGYKEIAIGFSDGCVVGIMQCGHLYIFELEPMFHEITDINILNGTKIKNILLKFPHVPGRVIESYVELPCIYCAATSEATFNDTYKTIYLNFKNGKVYLADSAMKKPPRTAKAIQASIIRVKADTKKENDEIIEAKNEGIQDIRGRSLQETNYHYTYREALDYIFEGNGKQAQQLIDNLLIGNVEDKKSFFERLVSDVCGINHGKEIIAMSQLSCH